MQVVSWFIVDIKHVDDSAGSMFHLVCIVMYWNCCQYRTYGADSHAGIKWYLILFYSGGHEWSKPYKDGLWDDQEVLVSGHHCSSVCQHLPFGSKPKTQAWLTLRAEVNSQCFFSQTFKQWKQCLIKTTYEKSLSLQSLDFLYQLN